MRNIILYSVLITCFLACKPTVKKEHNVTSSEVERSVEEDKFSDLPKEIFYANGNCILLLKPSKEYYDKFLKNEEGMEEVESDFDYYANQFYEEQKDNYKIYFVDARKVTLINSKRDTIRIDRYNKDLIYGFIIQINDSLKVSEGVFTDIDFKLELEEFILPKKLKVTNVDESKHFTIKLKELSNTFAFKFNYPKFSRVNIQEENQVFFSRNEIKVSINKKKFIKKKDSKKQNYFGVNYDFPNEIVSRIWKKGNSI